jgi:transposase
MAAPVGPKKVKRYSDEFKIQAVKLANHPDIQTQDVAQALDIHPFMLSKWKKDFREGRLKPANGAGVSLPKVLERQVKQLQGKVDARAEARKLERKLAALELEHELLKKAIRFNIERRRRSSSS